MRKYPRSIPGQKEKKIFDFLLRIFLSYINSSAHRTWFAFADDPYGWATSKLCQVTRLPMRACQWSEDENWEWTTTTTKVFQNYLDSFRNAVKESTSFSSLGARLSEESNTLFKAYQTILQWNIFSSKVFWNLSFTNIWL